MSDSMKPYQLYLTERQYQELDQLATRLKTSKAALVREGIDHLLSLRYQAEDDPALDLIGLAEGLDRPSDLAAEHDAYLAGDE